MLAILEKPVSDFQNHNLSDKDRFVSLLDNFESPLLNYVSRLMGSLNSEAEDFVQDTFLKFHKKVINDGWDSIDSPSNWLFRVAHNLVMDAGRKKTVEKKFKEFKVKNTATADDLEKEFNQLDMMVREEAGKKALEALQQLPEEEKKVLLLKIVQGFTLKEISDITGEKIGKIAYRINKGLERMHSILKKSGIV